MIKWCERAKKTTYTHTHRKTSQVVVCVAYGITIKCWLQIVSHAKGSKRTASTVIVTTAATTKTMMTTGKNRFQCIQKQRRSLCVSCLNFMRDLISAHCAIVRFSLAIYMSPSIQSIANEHVLIFTLHDNVVLPLGKCVLLAKRTTK